ncbi:hypothetical protein [Streptomyces sp. RKAG293]|uniref:hypothetical protein n=1 Tax=Streptomyces sp. RKAG293 TaxID=2893403 RepID=UPI002033E5C0|nr:hypothetical protein [Streptomyces sp. RKAG293]MCM2422180.1 hypothetical protein [Streptomyces sp. RKAG293]
MSFFRRPSSSTDFPPDVASRMEQFGRFEFDPTGSGIDASYVWNELQAPFLAFAQSDPDRFAEELAEAVLPAGGFALFGASRTIWSLAGSDCRSPSYDGVRMAALEFFRSNGITTSRISPDDYRFWREHRDEPWLVGRPRPAPDEAVITPLALGEVRPLARITAEAESNIIYVQSGPDGGYQAVVEARHSDTDPTRGHFDWLRAATLHSLYAQIGEAFQVPVHWVADELEPYIPLPPADL